MFVFFPCYIYKYKNDVHFKNNIIGMSLLEEDSSSYTSVGGPHQFSEFENTAVMVPIPETRIHVSDSEDIVFGVTLTLVSVSIPNDSYLQGEYPEFTMNNVAK